MTWSVWVHVPGTGAGWSRMFGGLTQAEAEWTSDQCFFESRAMPEEENA